MKESKTILLLLFALSILIFTGCQNKRSKTEAALSSIELSRGDITLCGDKQFGEVHFATSCSKETHETFDLAMSLLHSFEYDEAEKAFAKVIDADPNCAMAYWGIAMSNFHALWMQSGTGYLEKGSKVLEVAQSLKKSEREKDYLAAIGAFYIDWKTVDQKTRIHRYEKMMEKLYQKYTADTEAAVFYALALTASADPTDKIYANQRKSGKILESLFLEQPNHPGIAHYIIHNYDYPKLAEQALLTARRYAQIAPASAHAQHMPSHIFTRLGLWDESISSNINSTASAVCYAQSIDPEGHWDEELHGMDYLVYAYLQIGENEKANKQYEYLKTFKKVFPANFKIAYTAAAVPSRIALENRNWMEAARLELPTMDIDWQNFPWQQSILHFARALGSVRSGDVASSEQELVLLQSFHQKLLDKKEIYQANQVQIQMNTIKAWIDFENGNHEDALILMQEAADMENSTTKHSVTPGEVLPAGELLGDLLMLMERPLEALQAYENDLKRHPNRFNGIYGASVAAIAVKDQEKATKYFQLLLAQTSNATNDRLEIKQAKEFIRLAKKS